MKRPVAIFDLDGCLADFMAGFTTLANSQFGTPIVVGHSYPQWNDVPGLNIGHHRWVWKEIHESPDFWSKLEPLVVGDVFERIADLQEHADLYFVTNRSGVDPRGQTYTWLQHYGIEKPTVIISGRKGEVAAAIGAHYLIDDKAGNAIFTAYHSPETRCFLLDRPYNQFDHEVVGGSVERVDSVEEYLSHVELGC